MDYILESAHYTVGGRAKRSSGDAALLESPIFDIRSSLGLPPVVCYRGHETQLGGEVGPAPEALRATEAPLCQIDPDDANLFHMDASSLGWSDLSRSRSNAADA